MRDCNKELTSIFREAALCVQEGLLVDALHKFRKVRDDDVTGHLADDAQVNIGMCYYHMNQYHLAIEEFDRVITDYPDGQIEPYADCQEEGRTAAKALYGKFLCQLALGNEKEALSTLQALEDYPDSGLVTAGTRKPYSFIANTVFQAWVSSNSK